MLANLIKCTTTSEIQFVGRYSVNFGSTSSFTVTFGSALTGGIDTTPREGDFVLVVVAASSGGARTFSNSSGFTEIGEYYANASGTADTVVGAFYKVMGATPDTDIAITTNASLFPVTQVYVLRGVDPSTPLDVTTTSVEIASNAAIDPTSITPVTPGAAVLVVGCATGGGSLGNISETDLDDAASSNLSLFADILIGIKELDWQSGSVSPADLTGGSNRTASVCLTIAVRPA